MDELNGKKATEWETLHRVTTEACDPAEDTFDISFMWQRIWPCEHKDYLSQKGKLGQKPREVTRGGFQKPRNSGAQEGNVHPMFEPGYWELGTVLPPMINSGALDICGKMLSLSATVPEINV